QVLGLVPDRGDLAEHGAVGQPDGEPDQLVVVVGVGVLDLGEVRDVDQQLGVADRLGRLTGVQRLPVGTVQPQQEGAAVPVDAGDGQRTAAGGIGGERGTGDEPEIRI